MTELLGITRDQACRLTGLSKAQLRYWDATDFFHPTVTSGTVLYSFRDIVGLRTISILRDNLSLQRLRDVGRWLRTHHRTPWSSLRLYYGEGEVYLSPPDGGAPVLASGQQALGEVYLLEVAKDLQAVIRKMSSRASLDVGKIARRRNIVRNQPFFAGTRIPVAAVLEFKKAGYSDRSILVEYPRLRAADIAAAVKYDKQHLG